VTTATGTGTSTGTSTTTSTITSTVTTTTTGTVTTTGTGTATTGTITVTVTSTGTSVGPGADGGPRDGVTVDAMVGAPDAPAITPVADAAGLVPIDGGSPSTDALTGATGEVAAARKDGAQVAVIDGAGIDGAAPGKSGSSGGCGCVVGGTGSDPSGLWAFALFGLLVAGGIRRRRDRRRAGKRSRPA